MVPEDSSDATEGFCLKNLQLVGVRGRDLPAFPASEHCFCRKALALITEGTRNVLR